MAFSVPGWGWARCSQAPRGGQGVAGQAQQGLCAPRPAPTPFTLSAQLGLFPASVPVTIWQAGHQVPG